jgi:hypothetical protein
VRQMDQRAGRSKVALAKGMGRLWPGQFAQNLEADDRAHRDPRAIRRAAGIVESDVVELRTYGQVRKYSEIHAAAKAIREVGIGTEAVACREVPGARQELNERSYFRRVVHNDARAEHICVGIKGNAAWRSVIAAEVPDYTQVRDWLIGDRTADAILVEVCAAAEVEVRIADGSIDVGLGVRRHGEEEQSQTEHEQAFHQM